MKKMVVFLFLLPLSVFGQDIPVAGQYYEMNIAYDRESGMITGYYENATGYDDRTKKPMFYCTFYLEGKMTSNRINIKTYFPADKAKDMIKGQLAIINNHEFTVVLEEDHGGCWNVEHFAGKPAEFKLDQAKPWIQVRYAEKDKVFFYSEKSEAKKLKAYIVKGNVVYVERKEGHWLYCSYIGDEKTTQGWIKSDDLNTLELVK